MILITGANGNLGRSVVKQLLSVITESEFVVTASNENTLQKLIGEGYQARLANFNNPDTLLAAFQGISKLLLVSTMEQDRLEQHKNVIDQAKKAGVQHIVYTSLAIKNIEASAVRDLMISHFQTEEYIKKSGLTYTILRNTMYADALLQILGPNALDHDINLPGDHGKVPYLLRREMGEATANLLLQDGHDNVVYDFVGSRQFDYADIASTISELISNDIHYNNISDEEFRSILSKNGFPDFAIYLHAGTIRDIKNHQYEITNNIVEDLLGRKSAGLKTIIKELYNLK